MQKRVYVAGHQGMVGSAILRQLETDESIDLVTSSRRELDLTDQAAVNAFFSENQIDEVYHAAAKVGGIHANNSFPAEFIYQNLMVACNVVHAAYSAGISKVLLLGSSCIYPKLANQPMCESELLTSHLEPTNEPYAIAKIAGIKLCESYNRQYGTDFRSVMPTNLYGQNDNFHPLNSHVIPAMMLRFHNAKLANDEEVVVWGTGSPKREFMHVDDMASATVYLMNLSSEAYNSVTETRLTHINIGTGIDCTIRELAETLKAVVGFQGKLSFDDSKPDGTPRKLLDVSKLETLGWQASISLEEGLQQTYAWLLENQSALRVGSS